MFRIGAPTNPQPDDPSFPTEAAAISAAVEQAGWSSVVAVWNGPEDGDQTIGLAFQGQFFRAE